MFNITAFAIANSRLTACLLLMSLIVGAAVFTNYPSREDPSIVIRQASVTTTLSGLSPDRVEDLITRPIEEKIREIAEISHIYSDSKTGISLIKAEVRDDVDDLEAVWQELRDKLDEAARDLPDGVRGPILDDQVGLTAIASIALWGDGFSLPEIQHAAKLVRDQLYALDGIRRIDLYGEQDERIYIEFSRQRIVELGLDPRIIAQTLSSQNIVLPGGEIDADGLSIYLEPSGNFETVEEIAALLIPVSGGEVIRLDEIAALRQGTVEPAQAPAYFNGHPAIIISVAILDGVNSVEFGRRLKAKIGEIEGTLPWGFVLELATFQPDLVESAVGGAINNLYQTLGIVLAVTILFLGFRAGLIVGAFVPFTMLVGIIFMRLFDVELQRVSIAALIISLGMLVDNGLVVAEDIRVRLARGVARVEAAIAAGRSLALPLLTSSLTTILFFVPMALAEGGAGEYTQSLAQVVAIVLIASWFLAMFMIPTVAAWFMRAPQGEPSGGQDGRFYQGYARLLERALRWRYGVLSLAVLLLGLGGYILSKVDKEFFPIGDRNQFLVYLTLPAGTSTHKTEEVVERLVRWLGDGSINPEVASTVAYVSGGGPRFFLSLAPLDPDAHKAFVLVNTHTTDQVDTAVGRTRQRLLDAFPEALGEVKKMWMGASETGLYEVRLSGTDEGVLLEAAESLLAPLRLMPGILSAKQDWENPVLKLKVVIDQARARTAGLTSETVANALQAFFSGTAVTSFRQRELSIPVVVRAVATERGTLSALQAQQIYSASLDSWIPLTQIADIRGEWQPGRIKRRDQVRTVTISAKHAFLGAPEIHERLQSALDALALPAGHRFEIGGEIEKQAEANGRLFEKLPIALLAIVLLLIWQFNSIRRAGIILATIPLVLIGAALGLLVMQAPFGFMVILGFFSLAGIIINNGIVLIDRIVENEAAGSARRQAVIDASLARLRPILATTLTTVLGLLPLIISNDPLFYGMASAMAFGLAVGTLLTLFVVPVLYTTLFSMGGEATAK